MKFLQGRMDMLYVTLIPHVWKTEPEGKGKGNATALTKNYSTELPFLGDRILQTPLQLSKIKHYCTTRSRHSIWGAAGIAFPKRQQRNSSRRGSAQLVQGAQDFLRLSGSYQAEDRRVI